MIEGWLRCDEFSNYKIGITKDIQQRDPMYGEGWQLFQIANGDNSAIVQEEKELITYFTNHSDPELRKKCANVSGTGGQGNVNNANTLYVAVKHKYKTSTIEELHCPFSNISPIVL